MRIFQRFQHFQFTFTQASSALEGREGSSSHSTWDTSGENQKQLHFKIKDLKNNCRISHLSTPKVVTGKLSCRKSNFLYFFTFLSFGFKTHIFQISVSSKSAFLKISFWLKTEIFRTFLFSFGHLDCSVGLHPLSRGDGFDEVEVSLPNLENCFQHTSLINHHHHHCKRRNILIKNIKPIPRPVWPIRWEQGRGRDGAEARHWRRGRREIWPGSLSLSCSLSLSGQAALHHCH